MLEPMGAKSSVSKTALTAAALKATPALASNYVREILELAIDGIGPIRSAKDAANTHLVKHRGDVEAAVKSVIKIHVAYAGAEGFVTNLGGLIVAPVALPANVAALTLIKCHLVSVIAELRGYDLHDPRVRNAVLVTMMGRDTVTSMVRAKRLPSTPMTIATAPMVDGSLDQQISREVTSEILGSVVGRRVVTLVGRRVPLLGGAIGGVGDGVSTYLVGRYASDELRDRRINSAGVAHQT